MRKLLYLLVGVIALLGGCSRCDRHDDPAPDPCHLIKPASAAFIVQDIVINPDDSLWDRSYDTDTIRFTSAVFTAQDTSVLYEWIIGRDTLYDRTVSRRNFPENAAVDIELRVKKKRANLCLADSELTDTLKRRVYFQANGSTTLMNGRFRGYLNDNQADTITISYKDVVAGPQFFGTYFHNLKRNQTIYSHDGVFGFAAFRQVSFSTGYTVFLDSLVGDNHYVGLWGIGRLALNDSVWFKYTVRLIHKDFDQHITYSDSLIHYTFKGTKIQSL